MHILIPLKFTTDLGVLKVKYYISVPAYWMRVWCSLEPQYILARIQYWLKNQMSKI